MVGLTDYSSVPTSADLENNSNTKKYTVNDNRRGKVVISKLLCLFLVMGAFLLAVVAALAVYIFMPGCTEAAPEAYTSLADGQHTRSETNTRLPRSIQPMKYKLDIMPFLEEGNFTTHGFISIEILAKETTDKIVINANDLEIDPQTVRVKYLKGDLFVRILDQSLNKEDQIYTIVLERKLEKDIEYRLDMNFVGHLNDLMQGFYRSSYVDSVTRKIKWMASTQFSPTDARRAFPCFDEPSFKAKFTINIGRPANMTSLSNMPKKESVKSTEMEGWFWDKYEETPPMSSYLVAFIVSDLQPYDFTNLDRKFTIWTRRDAINQAVYSSKIAPKILKYLEDYFTIPYPLPKMDFVAVPDFGFNAMENWGLITFRETALLLDNKIATIDNKRSMALTMAHELTHQWFGNLATPKWWDDLWLKEGFASYFEYIGVNHVEPTWNITDEFASSEIKEAFEIDSLGSSRPLSFEVYNTDQIRQVFDKISYSKGASIINMMRHFLGEETFKAGLIHYLNKYKMSNANHDDLWNSLTEKAHSMGSLEANITVKEIMDTWAKQPGYPVVTAIANYEEGTVTVSQERFFISGDEDENELTWWVPISYATSTNPDFENTQAKMWIRNENSTTFNLDTNGAWWLLNLKQTGYYIVNYDERNWQNIVGNLMSFPPVIRGQLISNAMDLARADLLDYDIPFRLVLSTGRRDDHIVPYTEAFDKISFLYEMLITTPIFGKFDVFLLAAFNAAFDNTGFNESPNDSYIKQKMRRLILKWACKRTESRCVIQSRHLYRAWMTSQQPIVPNLRMIVYCTAIREGGEAEWDFAYEQYLRTTLVSEKETILYALGCTTKPWILTRYLNFMIDPNSGVRKQDGSSVFSSVANNIVGHSLAFDFLRSNWKEINDYYGVAFNRVGKMVSSLAVYMNTPYHLSQMESFKNENDLGTTKQAFENTIDTIKGNIQWMNQSYKSVEKWLNDHSRHFGL